MGQEGYIMRYDDYDDYNSRSSRSSSRRGSSSYSGGRDYDRGYSSRSSYDRYDRDYGSSYDRRSSDRYGSSYDRRGSSSYDDFDRYDWERTAPNWDDRGSSRSRSGGSSRSRGSSSRSYYDDDRRSSGSRSRGSSSGSRSRGGSSGSRSRGGSGRRPSDNRRGNSRGRKKGLPIVPIILGLVLIVLAVLIIKSFFGGGGGGYEIDFSSQTIVIGETATATVTGLSETDNYDVTWSSNDPNVVSVEGSGKTCTLTAKSTGTVTIAATINGDKTANGTVMVVSVAPGVVDIKVDQEEVTVKSGQTYTVSARVVMEDEEMAPAKISWSSKDASIARVDENGVITARDVGSTIIKATAGEKTAEIVVNVVENPDNDQHDESQSTGATTEDGSTGQNNTGGTTNNTGGTGTTGNTTGNTTGGNSTSGGTGNTGTGNGTTGSTGTGEGTTGDNSETTPNPEE